MSTIQSGIPSMNAGGGGRVKRDALVPDANMSPGPSMGITLPKKLREKIEAVVMAVDARQLINDLFAKFGVSCSSEGLISQYCDKMVTMLQPQFRSLITNVVTYAMYPTMELSMNIQGQLFRSFGDSALVMFNTDLNGMCPGMLPESQDCRTDSNLISCGAADTCPSGLRCCKHSCGQKICFSWTQQITTTTLGPVFQDMCPGMRLDNMRTCPTYLQPCSGQCSQGYLCCRHTCGERVCLPESDITTTPTTTTTTRIIIDTICMLQNPCENGGKCIDDFTSNRGYYCQCLEGFIGPLCSSVWTTIPTPTITTTITLNCSMVRCPSNTRCVMQKVECVREPCHRQPQCVAQPIIEPPRKPSPCYRRMNETAFKFAVSKSLCPQLPVTTCELSNGEMKEIHCVLATGMCWCVNTATGAVIMGTRVRGIPNCNAPRREEECMMDTACCKFVKCPENQECRLFQTNKVCESFPCDDMEARCVNRACPDGRKQYCCDVMSLRGPSSFCPAYPHAVARINPCGGCRIEHYVKVASGHVAKVDDCYTGIKQCKIEEGQRNLNNMHGNTKPGMMDLLNISSQTGSNTVGNDAKMQESRREDEPECTACCKNKICPANQECRIFQTMKQCIRAPCNNEVMVRCVEREGPTMTLPPSTCEDENQNGQGSESKFRQCGNGLCACKNSDNNDRTGTVGNNNIRCDKDGLLSGENGLIVCPNGQIAVRCDDSCKGRSCPNTPNANCTVDICDSCKVNFLSPDGTVISNCYEKRSDLTPPLRPDGAECEVKGERWYFDKTRQSCRVFTYNKCVGVKGYNYFTTERECINSTQSLLCEGKGPQVCHEVQTCRLHKDAKLVLDPCTCKQTYFDPVDETTEVNCDEVQTQCILKKGAVLRKRMLEKITGQKSETRIPECTDSGKFKNSQCSETECWCVNSMGEEIDNTRQSISYGNPKCDTMLTKNIVFTLTFKFSFSKVKGKENRFISFLKRKLILLGMPEGVIRKIHNLRDGSIKVDIELADEAEQDLEVYTTYVDQWVEKGELSVDLDGEILTADTEQEIQFERQISKEELPVVQPPPESDDDIELWIIIVAVCGGVFVLVMLIVVVCCIKRMTTANSKEDKANNYDHMYSPYTQPGQYQVKPTQPSIKGKAYDNNAYSHSTFERV